VKPENIIFRDAVHDDVDGLLHLWELMMAEHEKNDARIRLAEGSMEAYRAYVIHHLDNQEGKVIVAESSATIVAYCLVVINRNLPMFRPHYYGYLSDLVVAPKWRRNGIGSGLLERVSAWLKSRSILSVQLQYYQFNQLGEKFWKSRGFTPYYMRMWLDLE
jgi:GNAT superfamily N-acetyltransferase